MNMVDGSLTPNTIVWQETVNVSNATDYDFSGWAASMGQYPIGSHIDPSPARLRFFVNDVQIGSDFSTPAQNGQWSQFSAPWNSGTSSVATIKIVDMNTDFIGNDFTLDDLSFMPGAVNAQPMVSADTYIRTDLDIRRNDNYGLQGFIEVGTSRGGGGSPTEGPTPCGRSSVSTSPHSPNLWQRLNWI